MEPLTPPAVPGVVPVELTPLHPAYPSRLRGVPRAPATLHTSGGPLEAGTVVAIVGSRACSGDAAAFATRLAATIARAGGVVVSGGALGIDSAAHRGALEAGGRTWVVAPSGHNVLFPADNEDLFAEIARGPGAMIWPFSPDSPAHIGFHRRNRILAALADAMVVVQAGVRSGALHAAGCAHKLGKPLWVCPAAPWLEAFHGSRLLLEDPARTGARPLHSEKALLASVGLTPAGLATPATEPPLSPSEAALLRVASTTPLHLDALASRAGLPAAEAAVALLTLALENVVVEGPPGFFSRRDGR